MVPTSRVRAVNDAPLRPDRSFVLYWMIAARRLTDSFGLDRALEHARALGRPLLIFEPLRVDHRWASDRLHAFVIEGMRDHAARCREAGVTYLPWVEPAPGAGRGLLEALAARAAVVVTDTFPTTFLPHMVRAAGARLDVRLEEVDGIGLLPLRAHGRDFPVAHAFRRHLHKTLPAHLDDAPAVDPLAGYDLGPAALPELPRWGATDPGALLAGGLAALPIDHAVPRAPVPGGPVAGAATLATFLRVRLSAYAEARNQPDEDVGSGLSPYLHFGHVGAHQVFRALVAREGWDPGRLAPKPTGKREGWWGMSPEAEAFLDELITWREVGQGFCFHREDHDRYASLPAWALETLAEHANDPRPHVYTLDALEQARTHDPIWNAAQRQLRREGRVHNYLRMLWGKKVLEWSPSPAEAAERLIHLNDRWALDGRDANSYSGIFWTFGRFDRAWGPERPIFGKVRYMSSDATRRKLRIEPYLARWAR